MMTSLATDFRAFLDEVYLKKVLHDAYIQSPIHYMQFFEILD